jgi:IclR family pca regulon transcriptional regulator
MTFPTLVCEFLHTREGRIEPVQLHARPTAQGRCRFLISNIILMMGQRKITLLQREIMGGLAKGLTVIRAFTRDHPALTLSEVARETALPAATARRCLRTLQERGYVTRCGRSFLLRPKVLELGAAYLESMNIEGLTKTHLEGLARITQGSAALCVLDGAEIVYVACASVRTLVRLEAHVGSRFPAHATSTGRVLLSGLSRDRLERYFCTATLEVLTEKTVVRPVKLRRLIEECRRAGYAAVEDELAYGVTAVDVPVFDQERRIVASLNTTRTGSPRASCSATVWGCCGM